MFDRQDSEMGVPFRDPAIADLEALDAAALRARELARRQMRHAWELTLKALAARFAVIAAGRKVRHA